MKLSSLIHAALVALVPAVGMLSTLSDAAEIVAHHRHQAGHVAGHSIAHEHHKRSVSDAEEVTVWIYKFPDGTVISAADVKEGLANGTLALVPGETIPLSLLQDVSSSTAPTTVTSAVQTLKTSTTTSTKVTPEIIPTSSAPAPVTITPEAISTTSASAPAAVTPEAVSTAQPVVYTASNSEATPAASSATNPSSSGESSFLSAVGLDQVFPDGELACSVFPNQYGAIRLDYLGIGGWSGIQNPQVVSGGYSNIETVVASQCNGADCCSEGSFCSYACPPGYQKSQWPATQGTTGQSVGGIQCQNGKLHLTNTALSNKLCIPGALEIPIAVHNTMSKNVAICRTDYPGTEGETVPLDALPGTTQNVTCPDEEQYYNWLGKSTSAQYYVNPAGVSIQDACQWGTPGSNTGNYAPLNLGVGYSDGRAWLSIFQNAPTTDAKLDFKVEIVGDNGALDSLVGRCKYESGQYCSGDDYSDCTSTGDGCTVSVGSGTATFVISS